MSASSPFRVEDNSVYRWPPEGVSVDYETFKRVTKCLDEGSPKDWMEPYVGGKAKECFSENVAALLAYLAQQTFCVYDVLSDNFSPDPQWWLDQIAAAERADAKAKERQQQYDDGLIEGKRRPSSSRKLEALFDLTPAQRVGLYIADASKRHMRSAGVRGTYVHDCLERMALGEVINPDDTEHPAHVRAGIDFFKTMRPIFIEVESVAYSSHGYAGQFDGIAKIPVTAMMQRKQWNRVLERYEPWTDTRNRSAETYDPDFITVFLDWKTSEKGIKQSVPYQIAAYAFADFIGRPDGSKDPIPHCDEFWGVNITADKWNIVPLDVNAGVFEEFLAIKRMGESSKIDHRQPMLLAASDKFLDEYVPGIPQLEVL